MHASSSSSPAAIRRELLGLAGPILVAQLASIGMMLVDTAVLGRVGPEDLAAVAIGGGLHVSLLFALSGVLQSLGPVVARLHGAGQTAQCGEMFRQALWLALVLSLPGIFCLLHPEPLLGLVAIEPAVEHRVRAYLAVLAPAVPLALCYRVFYVFCNALGRARVPMGIGLVALVLHAGLAWGLAAAGWWGGPLGVVGCAISNVCLGLLSCAAAVLYLFRAGSLRTLHLLSGWRRPDIAAWRTLLRLGLPMGVSNFVEITSFALISLLIAPLGASQVAGHRIAANLAALAYMLPLSLGIAAMVLAGHALGAKARSRLLMVVAQATRLAAGISLVSGGILWTLARPLAELYTDDAAVAALAASLLRYIAVYQFFDALQTMASHVLRACHVTLAPMLLQTACFWGLGLLGGAWFCYRADPPMGVAGFWLAAILSLALAAAMLRYLQSMALRRIAGSL